jgi:hypothetical protein
MSGVGQTLLARWKIVMSVPAHLMTASSGKAVFVSARRPFRFAIALR